MRVVLDTNVLIDGFNDDFSVQAKLIDSVCNKQLQALITPAITREYRNILRRLIDDGEYKSKIENFLEMAVSVKPVRVDAQIDDPDDYKFLQAAVGGNADAVVSNDRHLLDLGELGDIRVMAPQECWAVFEDEKDGSSEWKSFMQNLGIGN